jgi:hypothetical protein
MSTTSTSLWFGQRFCGPPGMANGGFACGSVAALAGGPAAVTLRRPVPLERPLAVHRGDDGAVLIQDEGMLVVEARPATAVHGPAAPEVTGEQARAAAGGARYYTDPVFPGCFVCGPDRMPGDGLRIFPGPVPGRQAWAAPWTPDSLVAGADGRVAPEIVWAALDCPSGIAAAEAADLPGGTAVLLGRMTASVAARPRPGEECRVVGWPGTREGRKLTAFSALLGPGGEVLASAVAVWLTVPRPAAAAAGRAL